MKKLWMLVAVLAVTGIASAELLEDGGFEEGFLPWGRGIDGAQWNLEFHGVGGGTFTGTSWYYGSHTVIADPWAARSGDRYLREGIHVPSWVGSPSWGYCELGQSVTAAEGAAPGVEYTLTAYFMDDLGYWGDTGKFYVHLNMNFFNGTTRIEQNTSGPIELSSDWNVGWQPVSVTFTSPTTPPTTEIRVLVGSDTSYGFADPSDWGAVRIDDVTLCTTDAVAAQPDPADGATVASACQTALSWETCAAGTFNVYLAEGVANDPNNPPVWGSPIATGVTTDTVAVTLANNKNYVWRVDGAAAGAVWSFSTGDVAPEVGAGNAQYLVLGETASLDGSLICDDGNSSPVTYLWTVDPAGPVIASDTSLVTTATIAAAGSYTFTLTATDGATNAGSDTVTVNVYDDACAAALADPADYTALFDGDITGDCLVNLNDFAAMAIDWLDCASAKLGCTP